jgi:2-dehydropantoate 2-reductase
MSLSVVVAGAGAVGSVIGGRLAAAGHDVLLVGRDPHMAAIARGGLSITGLFGDHRTHPRTTTSLDEARREAAGRADFVLVTVKSTATCEVARELAGWTSERTSFVSMQNGLGNVETLAAAVGAARALGARVIFGALVREPGAVHVTVCAQPVAVGPPVPDARLGAVAASLAGAIDAAGVPCVPVETITPLLWEKVLYNCGLNPLGALHGLTYGEVAADDALRPLLDAAIDEGFAVAVRSGVALRWADAASFREYFHEVLLPPTRAHRSSMRQDLEAGRRTEIDAISGAIVRAGARIGVATPVNSMLVERVHFAERG